MELNEVYSLYMSKVNSYIHVENGGDYYTEKIGDTLYIYFEGSTTAVDW